MSMMKSGSAKNVAIMAMCVALYAVFFFFSQTLKAIPNFTLLYLPIILLGVFPLWFGRSGLVGCIIGAYVGGVFVENLPLHFAWAESVTALLIFGLNWLLISKSAAEVKTSKGLLLLLLAYTLTLFVGTAYVLWQLAWLGAFPFAFAEVSLLPTFAFNLPIVLICCPALIRAISPKLKCWGIYSGTFWEWRSRKAKV